jgi:membrane protease YdiL (CAAX protease family)
MNQRGPAFSPFGALAVMSVSFATFLVVTSVAVGAGAPTIAALIIGELMFVAIPFGACLSKRKPLAAVGLTRPRGRLLGAATLIGLSAWYVNLWLVSLLPVPEGNVTTLEQIVEQPPLALALFAIGLLPAVCEEVLFRGVVLRGLASRFVPLVAIVFSAALFSAYHMSLLQLLPTFTLGLLLGLLALRGDSVLPAMLAHLLNNSMAILVHRRAMPGVSWMEHHPGVTLVTAAVLTTAGVVLALRGKAVA